MTKPNQTHLVLLLGELLHRFETGDGDPVGRFAGSGSGGGSIAAQSPTPTRSLDRRPLACRAVPALLEGEEMGRAGAGTNAAHCEARATEPARAATVVSLVEGMLFNTYA